MQLPAYWLPRPELRLDEATQARLEAIHKSWVAPGRGGWVRAKLPVPRWQFLCWLADRKGHLLHGTADPGIAVFEPRQSNDVGEFGNRKAIYAASDGIWPMFFAVTDRARYPMSISNAAIRMELPSGQVTEPFYFFSLSDTAHIQRPWRSGVVYVLGREGFEEEPALSHSGVRVHTNHWASPQAAKPLAKIRVRPEDFPFLAQVRPHNDEVLFARAKADPNGFPWLD